MTETEPRAAQAWAAMIRPVTIFTRICGEQPMPPAIALDMVQDATGDRDDAVVAIHGAAANWLADQTPAPPSMREVEPGEIEDGCRAAANAVRDYLRGEIYRMAETFLSHVRELCNRAVDPRASGRDRMASLEWTAWAKQADRAIELCRAVCVAAYPPGS